MRNAPSTLNRPRELSRLGKGILLLLLAYAAVVFLPDTLRPMPFYQYFYYHVAGWTPKNHWYPLGLVCFTADNDGRVTSVGDCGPTSHQLQVGDQIDFRAMAKSDRRAVVLGGGWAAHGRAVTLKVVKTNGDQEVQVMPIDEVLQFFGKSSPKTWTLMLDQVAGLFFIGLTALCVWRRPTKVTWGFFLYSIWYNSGQIAILYANLPAESLQWFEWLQAVLSGAGLTGLLMFGLHFPRDSVTEWWWRPADSWLVIPFVTLTVLNLWSLRNFTEGVRTEGAGDVVESL